MNNKHYFFLYTFTAIFSMLVFIPAVFLKTGPTDHLSHIVFAIRAVKEGVYPHPHFLFHLLLNILTGFSAYPNPGLIMGAAVFLLTSAVLLKVKLSSLILDFLLEKHSVKISINKKVLILLALFFISPIMNWWKFPAIYLGQFPPNIWHNSTTIMLVPFSLAIVFLIEKQRVHNLPASLFGSIILAFSVLMKPNFAMVLLPSLFLFVLLKRFTFKDLIIYSVPALIVLVWQLYQYQPHAPGESHIIFSPMSVWMMYSKHPIGSILVSLAFPITATLFFRKHFKNVNLVILGWVLVFISIAQFALFAESGSRQSHGNFLWASIPSLYILFLVLMVELASIKVGDNRIHKIKYNTCFFLLALHLISGVVFYVRSIFYGWEA